MIVTLSSFDLFLASLLVLALAVTSYYSGWGLSRQIIVAAIRTTVQLSLVGWVLHIVFGNQNLLWIALLSMLMLLVAGWEVVARQKRRLNGIWGFAIGTFSMFISSFSVTILALIVIIGNTPWYSPQYAIPLLGMLLGNTMNGIALGMDRLMQTVWQQRAVVEQRLLLGQTGKQAIVDIQRDSVRAGMIPIINAMTVAGIVSLPGMMTGQILAGTPPMEAVKYQILIMFLIATGTGFGILFALWLTARRLFDKRHRLCLDVMTKNYGINS